MNILNLYSGVTFVMVNQPALETGFVGVGADPAQDQATVRVSAHASPKDLNVNGLLVDFAHDGP